MTHAERYELIIEMHRNGATHQQMAERCEITVRRVLQILAGGPPEPRRLVIRGRPCPRLIDGERCACSSRVVKVWQIDEQDVALRLRECVVCKHRWYTTEKNCTDLKEIHP